MRAFLLSLAVLLAVPALADADRKEPNSFLMLGFDVKAKKLYLKEEISKKGPNDLWTIDFASPGEPHIQIAPIDEKVPLPTGLTVVKSVQLEDVELSGAVRKESLERHGNQLRRRFDLRISVGLSTAKSTSDFIAYQTPEVQLVEAYRLPEGESVCSVAVVSYTATLTGVVVQRPLVMCPVGGAGSKKK